MNLLKIGVKYDLSYKALLAFVFMIPLSQYVSTKLLIVTLVLSLLERDIKIGLSKLFQSSWEILGYILVLILGLLYSLDIESGLRVIETNLSFLAVPLIFSFIYDFDEKRLNTIFTSFGIGLFIACAICLVNASITFSKTNELQSYFFYDLTDILKFQPTYFAYYLIFVITYMLYRSYYQLAKINYWLNCSIIIFFFLMLMLTGGQTAFVSLLLILSFFVLKFMLEDKSIEKRIVVGLVGLMLVGMFLATLVDKGERNLSLNDSWDRLVLWESAIDATPDLIFGVGTGDYKTMLNEYYRGHRLQKFAEESYNSHNQFIQILFSNGLLGVISIILLIGRSLYLSSKNHNLLGILLVFPFLLYGMTEVFLGRYQGVVFFVLIHQLCLVQTRIGRPYPG